MHVIYHILLLQLAHAKHLHLVWQKVPQMGTNSTLLQLLLWPVADNVTNILICQKVTVLGHVQLFIEV